MANGKLKLELTVNFPTRIKLLQDKPATGESTYGKWYLYSVVSDETEMSFFAPEQVQKFIEDNQLKKGDELEITKTLTKNGKANVVDYKIELLTKQEPVTSKPVTNSNNKPDDIKIMRDCLIASIDLQKELGSVVDVNKIAMSLYISRSKNGNGYQF